MKFRVSQTLRRKIFGLMFVIALVGVLCGQSFAAARLSPKLQSKLNGLANSAQVGMVIVAFKTNNGLQLTHLNVLRSVGVLGGQTFPTLGMVAQPMTAGQVRALAYNPSVRSIWSNDRLYYFMHQARVLAGVQQMENDRSFQFRNGGLPVSGAGDFSVLVIDSGVDATHADLQFGSKVVQNVQTLVGAGTLPGFTPNVSLENVPNTDQSVGHGTHCAGIIGGTGVRSGGQIVGVAPGAKIIGSGLGAGLFVLNAIAAWEWGLTNQYRYNIRVVSNSYGGDGAFDPSDPITIASKMAYDRNIAVVFAGGNSGPTKNTYNPYAKAPWVIGVAAGTKEGELADFSSRGTPRAERLGNTDPNDDFDAPTITAPGEGRVFVGENPHNFTASIVATRSTSNLVANGLTDDAELSPSLIPFYTQIQGTSKATPFVAGTIALMLDADPTLSVDEIKEILTSTATKMPGKADWEVGAGYLNVYAAIDKVFNRSRNYANFQDVQFNAVFGEQRPAQQNFHLDFNPAVSGATSANATTFTVEAGMNVLDVYATVDTLAGGTGNLVGIRITSPSGVGYSTAIDYPVIGTMAREIVVQNPEAGTWTLEVRGARGLTAAQAVSSPVQIASPGPVDGNIVQIKYTLPNIPDIQSHPQREAIEAALKNRVIDVYADGTFKPNDVVTREDFARSLVLNTSLRQSLSPTPRFTDVSGDLARIAQAVTAYGSTLRDFNYDPQGIMNSDGATFNPQGSVNRLDLAVAFVRALGYDPQARALENSDVTSNGTILSDNAEIPAELRGYVQIALNKGLFEAFPAQVIEVAPGQFQALPGPRFEPNTTVNRATLAIKLNSYRQLFTTGG
jgi:serine protease AprX